MWAVIAALDPDIERAGGDARDMWESAVRIAACIEPRSERHPRTIDDLVRGGAGLGGGPPSHSDSSTPPPSALWVCSVFRVVRIAFCSSVDGEIDADADDASPSPDGLGGKIDIREPGMPPPLVATLRDEIAHWAAPQQGLGDGRKRGKTIPSRAHQHPVLVCSMHDADGFMVCVRKGEQFRAAILNGNASSTDPIVTFLPHSPVDAMVDLLPFPFPTSLYTLQLRESHA